MFVSSYISCCVLLLGLTSLSHIHGYEYTINRFTVPVDHFSFSNNDTFEIRYLVNDKYYNNETGPIFFYTGNEGDIELFANNTGFVWDIAPQFQALVVFAEHRYYGESMPFGNKSFSEPRYTGYLTSQQALADYVDLLTVLKRQGQGRSDVPVVAFGGSYGGMLSAYMRMKYPHIIAGAIASSAPIWQFTGMTSPYAFSRIVTSDYSAENRTCSDLIRKSWKALSDTTSTDEGLSWVSKTWRICQPLKSSEVSTLKGWLVETYTNLAMVNYPYPTNFLADLPGFPIREACKHLTNTTASGKTLLKDIFKGVSVFFNYTGNAKCLDIGQTATPALGDNGWSYQSCTEMVMPMSNDGKADMFEKSAWNLKTFSDDCFQQWKVRPQPELAEKIYGGKYITSASNIVFSNGLLDPWSSGGVLKSLSKSVLAVIIPESAHHLDLRASNPEDPLSVRQARKLYQTLIQKWINWPTRTEDEEDKEMGEEEVAGDS